MKYGTIATAVIIFLLSATSPNASEGKSDFSILKTLRPEHPRLIAHDSDVERVKQLIRTNPDARSLYERTRVEADRIMGEPLIEYSANDFRVNIVPIKVLLGQSRECLYRTYTLLTVYRLDGDKKYMERAKKELMKAADLPDWNPMHFLDVAEMTHAVAIGYDWMYQDLTENERRILREAIIENGLKPAQKAYRLKWLSLYGFWTVAEHNWNQVCNGGIVLGALAIADEEPRLAEQILESALASVKIAMAKFAPDGAWAEGPSYWSYATEYNVFLIAGLKSALGTDLGLSGTPGFDKTGMFRVHYIGPLGLTFNYADAPSKTRADEQMFWLAREFNEPLYAWHARKYLPTTKAIGLWWFDPRGEAPEGLSLDVLFRGADVAFMRSAWDDPDAIFVGVKGGDNKANHSHLDLGTFVLDALGVRWALDLGKDSYSLPLYFDSFITKRRWTYYRLRTEGHNTLVLDSKNQRASAKSPIIAFKTTPQKTFAVADLSDAYKPMANSVVRGVAMVERSRVIVQDEIEAKRPVSVVWGFHTEAKIDINGQVAILTQDGAHLAVRIIEPSDAYFEVLSAWQKPPQNPNEGVSNLTVKLPIKIKNARIVVELIPFRGEFSAPSPDKIIPLSKW